MLSWQHELLHMFHSRTLSSPHCFLYTSASAWFKVNKIVKSHKLYNVYKYSYEFNNWPRELLLGSQHYELRNKYRRIDKYKYNFKKPLINDRVFHYTPLNFILIASLNRTNTHPQQCMSFKRTPVPLLQTTGTSLSKQL